jgi:hypothetical protein
MVQILESRVDLELPLDEGIVSLIAQIPNHLSWIPYSLLRPHSRVPANCTLYSCRKAVFPSIVFTTSSSWSRRGFRRTP